MCVLFSEAFFLFVQSEDDLPSETEDDEICAIAAASAGAFATTMIGVPSGANVTETELVTMAVTVRFPLALAC